MSSSLPSKGHILIAEDVYVTAFKMAEALRAAGFDVETAADGEECLRKTQEILPQLLILDIMLPKVHGIEVLKTLRDEHRTARIGVIVCTAKDFKTEHAETARLGVFEFLAKPVETSVLVEKVEAYFSQAGGFRGAPEFSVPTIENRDRPAPFVPVLEVDRPHCTLWGTRGSTPTPGARFLRHGGHTSCLSVVLGDEQFIFDAGSGIRELGFEVLRTPRRKLHLFITHTHWDHIQGFPFFTPAYLADFQITIYGAEGFGKDLRSVFRGQLDREYFPVQMEDMQSSLEFHQLADHPMQIGSAQISWEFAQHPGATVGYKIQIRDTKIAWVPDNEFLQGYTGAPEELTRGHPLVEPYGRMIDFLADADVVIHEAQYTCDEYLRKIGWGHSSVANACVLMKLAGVRHWIVTHHDPMHDDAALDAKLHLTRQIAERLGHDMHVTHAYDGQTEYFR